jgi:hypothetical protein
MAQFTKTSELTEESRVSIPVVRAEEFYKPPPNLRPDAWQLVPPAELVFHWVSHRLRRTTTAPQGFAIGQLRFARINHNRWVADCPCGSAQVVSPADQRMACTECGLGWMTLTFPESPDAVEESLDPLLPHERNWWHDEDPAAPVPPPVEPEPTEPEPPIEGGV